MENKSFQEKSVCRHDGGDRAALAAVVSGIMLTVYAMLLTWINLRYTVFGPLRFFVFFLILLLWGSFAVFSRSPHRNMFRLFERTSYAFLGISMLFFLIAEAELCHRLRYLYASPFEWGFFGVGGFLFIAVWLLFFTTCSKRTEPEK